MISTLFSRLNIFNSKLVFLLAVFFLSVVTMNAATITKNVGGFIYKGNTDDIVQPGVTVLLIIGTGDSTHPLETERMLLTSGPDGHYGTTKTFYCGFYDVKAYIVLDDGSLVAGRGSGGAMPCNNDIDWSNRYSLYLGNRAAQNNPQNAGDTCPLQSKGEPVNVTNGNMWLKQNDYVLPGVGENIKMTRTYNSMDPSLGLFGIGWSTDFDQNITISNNLLKLNLGNGQSVFFFDAGSSGYVSLLGDFHAQLVKNPNTTGSYTLTYKDGRVHQFTQYKLAWMKDRNGNQTTLTYNGSGRLATVTDAAGRTLNFTQTSNKVTQISDSLGTIATYEYNSNSSLKTVTYADGSKYKFEYDTTTATGKILLKTVKDALDNILETHLYDSEGRATTSEKHGGVEKYTLDYSHIYDAEPYTTVTDALGRVAKYYFDKSKGRNVVTKAEGNCGCGGSSEITTYEYDSKLNLTKTTDALNRETNYTYDANGNLLTMTDVWGTETFTYNSLGQILTYTDRMNGVWTNTYDANGNLLTAKDALNNITTVEYPTTNNKGLPDSIKDARNNLTKFKWFTSGLLEEIEDANGKKSNLTYDARGRTKTVIDALNQTTTYNYFDDTQRKVETIFPNADKITYKYNVRRLLESMTDERGKITSYEFDSARRLKKITDPLNHAKEIGYDLMSNPIWQKDALGNQTDFVYDDFNRLKEIQYPIAETGATRLVEKIEYDAVGRIKKFYDTANRLTAYGYNDATRTNTVTNAELEVTTTKYNQRFQNTEVKDALNQIYTFSYDALGRKLSQTRAGATMSFEYDAVGNSTKRTDYGGRETTYEYDVLNRLKKINYLPANSSVPIETAEYTYDDISRVKTAVNAAGTVTLDYDNRDRLTSTTDVFGNLINYEYEQTSTVNQKRLKFDGTMYAVYNFDDADRLTSLVDSNDSTTISFGYDNADRLTSKTLPNGITTTVEYDGMSRLKRLKDASSSATLFDRQYGYNNASQIDQIAEPSNTRSIGYDLVNRLTSVTASNNQNESYSFDDVGNRTSSHLSASYAYQTGQFNRLTSTTNAAYTYDANGNTATKSDGLILWQYDWDYENRLTQVSNGSQTAHYKYDALGRRVERSLPAAGENTKFIYDGQDVLIDDNSGTLTKYQNGLGIDDKLKVSLNGTAKYFLTDHLGSTNALTDASGAITESANYDSFGNATGSLSTRYQFTGREFDNFTGLHFYRARWYDANLGRFLSEDPIGFAGGDVNLYGYVRNSPLNLTDPTGNFPIWDHAWYYYYSKKCAETGIECANTLNGANQSQSDLERMAQESFDRGSSSISGLRFKSGYGDNYYCRQMERYAGQVYADSFPTNVQRVDPNGSITETGKNVAKTRPLSKASAAWEWIKSWF